MLTLSLVSGATIQTQRLSYVDAAKTLAYTLGKTSQFGCEIRRFMM